MLEPGISIVAIEGVEIQRDPDDANHDALWLRLHLSDGSVAATWWPLIEMTRFCSRVDLGCRRPLDATVQ